jgi:TM2 domain-containing membrane protein YozV
MARRETGTAYLLWCASLLGVCGLHRYYLGQTLVGTLYLLSFGFCGIGQLMDLFLIPGLVERSNRADAAHRLLTGPLATASLVMVDGDSENQVLPQGSPVPLTLEQQILKRCEHEPASLAHFILATGEPSGKIRAVVEEMAAQGLLRQTISDSGSVLYQLH